MDNSDVFPFAPSLPHLVAIDSDGCVFDTMAAKHLRCFLPAFVEVFGLAPVAGAATEVWAYVNLGSPTRGINRFKALLRALDLLAAHPEAKSRGFEVPRLPLLAEWVARAAALSNPALERARAERPSAEFDRVLAWSRLVNENVEAAGDPLPPFVGARAAIEAMGGRADLFVLSQTPGKALRREWDACGLAGRLRALVGQEAGPKSDCLSTASTGYAAGKVLMLGDAPGDREAARASGACFFPIIPGREAESWRLLLDDGFGRFLSGNFAGEFQGILDTEFSAAFPVLPPWNGEVSTRSDFDGAEPGLVA